MRLLTAAAMRRADERCGTGFGIPPRELMDRAGRISALAALRLLEADGRHRVAAVCGRGNNGGDGIAAALHLAFLGRESQIVLAGDGAPAGDAAHFLDLARKAGVPVTQVPDGRSLSLLLASLEDVLVLDALFGTGFRPPPREPWPGMIAALNACGHPILALDLPSGLDADTGRVGAPAVRAAWTVTMGAVKPALAVYPAAALRGGLTVADIGHPPAVLVDESHSWILTEAEWCRSTLHPRPPDAHKGSTGHLLVLAGSRALPGAALLAALGAVRGGAGLVTLGSPGKLAATFTPALPEMIPLSLPAARDGALDAGALPLILERAAGKRAAVIGPGLTLSGSVSAVLRRLLPSLDMPVVLDADALNAVAADPSILDGLSAPLVMTPHPGELARLLDTTPAGVQEDRLGAAIEAARIFRCTVVLKGAGTITAEAGGRVFVNVTGNPGMACGGMGDVLAGLVGAFLVQGHEAPVAAALAVYLHGLAGDLAAGGIGPVGFTARETADRLPEALRRVLAGHQDIDLLGP